jgi:D-alanyl-lipoteichoic acid acyltransferase DltB (MBOAT superfamily)
MLFNSYAFIFLYLPVVFAGMFWLGKRSHRLAALWLGLASLAFYAVWDPRFVLLLLASIAFNYAAGYWIGASRENSERVIKPTLIAAIVANLVLLGYFKYTNFFLVSVNQILGAHFPALDIILPLGISFFTFTQIAFLVDVYRGVVREYSFIDYLLFVTYFPHLIAGPVLHHKQMMPQFADPKTYRINLEHVAVGATIFVLGLAKKVLLADTMAEYATPAFAAVRDGTMLSMLEAWVGALAYTLQLYFDFSGYSDMAVGLSLMFNVRLPLNFDSPYKSTNIIEFWRRWHISLSTFLRDYLYIALGGNRKGTTRRYINLMLTMLLGGLWHGAGLTFVVWGGLHGMYLAINHGWRAFKQRFGWRASGRIARCGGGLLTFLAVVVAWVFFRADSVSDATSMLSSMAGMNELLPERWVKSRKAVREIMVCLVVVWCLPNVRQMLQGCKPTWEDVTGKATPAALPKGRVMQWLTWRFTTLHAALLAMLFIWCINCLTNVSEFLYFRF